jgi:hypothetical protein
MSGARNGLALAAPSQEDTPPFGCKRSDLRTLLQHLQSPRGTGCLLCGGLALIMTGLPNSLPCDLNRLPLPSLPVLDHVAQAGEGREMLANHQGLLLCRTVKDSALAGSGFLGHDVVDRGPVRVLQMKGIATVQLTDGTICEAEIHWIEAHGIGRKDFKIKRVIR